jgi:hypothetical protein
MNGFLAGGLEILGAGVEAKMETFPDPHHHKTPAYI